MKSKELGQCVITELWLARDRYHSVQVAPTGISFATFGLEDLRNLQAALARAYAETGLAIDRLRAGEEVKS